MYHVNIEKAHVLIKLCHARSIFFSLRQTLTDHIIRLVSFFFFYTTTCGRLDFVPLAVRKWSDGTVTVDSVHSETSQTPSIYYVAALWYSEKSIYTFPIIKRCNALFKNSQILSLNSSLIVNKLFIPIKIDLAFSSRKKKSGLNSGVV